MRDAVKSAPKSAGRAQDVRARAAVNATHASSCKHCGEPLNAASPKDFCCFGCRAVYRLLHESGLTRFYALRGARGAPVGELGLEGRDSKWLEPLEERLQEDATCRLQLDVQGLRCSACVWLIQELFKRQPGALHATVNPAVGRVDFGVERGFPLRHWVEQVERFGYLLGPATKQVDSTNDELLLRTGVACALAVNVMMFSAAIYLGLQDGPLHSVLQKLSYGMAVVSVVVGGPVFFRSAWQGLKQRVLHLDVPIALGILLAFAGSTWSHFFGAGRAAYLDTLTVFIALMLVGRYLQERMVARNRSQLLASDGGDSLRTRRLSGGKPELVRCNALRAGDELLIAPGDLIPVGGELLDEAASCSLDWINGESAPRSFAAGEHIPAGAFNLGVRAVRVRACEPFAASVLPGLLRNPDMSADASVRSEWWQKVSRAYVLGVLATASLGMVFWLLRGAGLTKSLEVTTAVLVVTCPCAFGIATPLAYDLVQAGLRRAGLFVREGGFLDRAQHIRRVVFDKTGTLTTGKLELVDEAPLDGLSAAERKALYDLVSRSGHPKSVATRRALETYDVSLRPDVVVDERSGSGLEARLEGKLHRFGSPAWAASRPVPTGCDVVYAVDGEPRAAFRTREALRGDAAAEIRRLGNEGLDAWIVSGDSQANVDAMAQSLGLRADRAVGSKRPEEKAAWLAAHDAEHALMIGDGINDSLALQAAACAGTPSIDRPFMPARADFYFVTPGLHPVGLALRASRALRRVIRRNLAFAVAYNLLAVGIAFAGWMKPWLAALLMPASSLAIVAFTAASLSKGSALWRS